MTTYFDTVSSYAKEQGFDLRPAQISLLHSLDAAKAYRTWFMRETDNGHGQGLSATPVSLYMGIRAGHTTLWRWVKAAMPEAVDIVYPSAQEAKLHKRADEAQAWSLKEYTTHLLKLNMAWKEDWANVEAAPKLVIFDMAGVYRFNGFKGEQHADLYKCLRVLDERNVLTIIS